jgi:hypothetical protein
LPCKSCSFGLMVMLGKTTSNPEFWCQTVSDFFFSLYDFVLRWIGVLGGQMAPRAFIFLLNNRGNKVEKIGLRKGVNGARKALNVERPLLGRRCKRKWEAKNF